MCARTRKPTALKKLARVKTKMAALLAAGAASSCAGLILGSYAMKPKQNTPPNSASSRGVQGTQGNQWQQLQGGSGSGGKPLTRLYAPASLPPVTSVAPVTSPPILLPPPRAPLPGQCPLCHAWFQQGDVVAKLECGHVNHRVCTEVVSRQPVYVGYRCSCAVCRGPSMIVKFAVAEFVPPSQQTSAPPRNPLPPPPLPSPSPVPPSVPVPPLPVAVVTQPILTSAPRQTETQAPPLIAGGHTPFHLTSNRLQGGARAVYPSCTLCDCAECRAGADGNCPTCGRCLCFRCTQGLCECACICNHDEDQLRSSLLSLY